MVGGWGEGEVCVFVCGENVWFIATMGGRRRTTKTQQSNQGRIQIWILPI